MKIVCVGYLHGSGGAERQIVMLSNAMAKRGHEVHLIVLVDFNSKYQICDNVIVHNLANKEKKGKLKILKRYLMLKRLMEKIQPDISVHYWLQSAYFCSIMPSKVTGKIIYSERGDPGDAEYNGLLGIIRSVAFKRIHGFVFQSEGARDYFDMNIKIRSVVIHNSIFISDEQYVKPCKERRKKIVTVGRLHEQKNQRLLIDAFAKIADDFQEYSLEIFGTGELESVLLKHIKELHLEDRIFLRGNRTNILDYIYDASLFVLTSDYEGMPNALMEAMAIGVPCISTDCKPGGARTLINNGVNGFIVPVNDILALANSMENVLNNQELAESVAIEGMKIRNNHTQIKIFDQWESFFLKLLK